MNPAHPLFFRQAPPIGQMAPHCQILLRLGLVLAGPLMHTR